ncbi:MAG: hypothetical protein MI923_08395, partial [Phycisphaerales bacterium]|nr:hypothetical protein [Phycisphaerales bacterium]
MAGSTSTARLQRHHLSNVAASIVFCRLDVQKAQQRLFPEIRQFLLQRRVSVQTVGGKPPESRGFRGRCRDIRKSVDWVVVGAVWREPVSRCGFPVQQGKYRE